jgi:hypothetical protein
VSHHKSGTARLNADCKTGRHGHLQTLATDRFAHGGAENKTALNNMYAELLQRIEKEEDALRLPRKNNSGDET